MFILYLVFNGYPEKGLWKMESIQPKGQRDNKMYSVFKIILLPYQQIICFLHVLTWTEIITFSHQVYRHFSLLLLFHIWFIIAIWIFDGKNLQKSLQLYTYTRPHCSPMISLWTMCVNIKWVFTKVIRICFM